MSTVGARASLRPGFLSKRRTRGDEDESLVRQAEGVIELLQLRLQCVRNNKIMVDQFFNDTT
jgi:hypothetical protein